MRFTALFLIIVIAACANRTDEIAKRAAVDYERPIAEAAVKDTTESGVFDDGSGISIKSRGRSFLTVLDDVARTKRFNYTVAADISRFYIDYFDFAKDEDALAFKRDGARAWGRLTQKNFKTIDEFVAYSVQTIRHAYANAQDPELKAKALHLAYRWAGDGFEFYDSQSSKGEPVAGTPLPFKKIFLFNLTEKEVGYYISRLLNVPYTPFNPSVPQKLSKPVTVSSVVEPGSGNASGPSDDQPATDKSLWQMGRHIEEGAPDRDVRWVSLPQQNAILIKAPKPILDELSQLLFSLDAEYRQVMIEAKVFEYDVSVAKKIGVALDITRIVRDPAVSVVNGAKVSSVNESFRMKSLFGDDVFNSLPTFFYSLTDTEKAYTLLASMAANTHDNLVRVSAEPRILLRPGQESTVDLTTSKVIQAQAPVAAGQGTSIVGSPIVKEVVVGTFLTVRPTILSENKIQLDLRMKQSDFIPTPTSEPNTLITTSQNQLLTSLVANDGELLSLGGVERKSTSFDSNGIPSLKDIDILGTLFGQKSNDVSVQKVEFFIRPIIKRTRETGAAILKDVNAINKNVNQEMERKLDWTIEP